MDIIAIIFLIFGWVFDVTGLKIASLSMAGIVFVFIAIYYFTNGRSLEGKFFKTVLWVIVLALSIVSLAI